MHWLHYLKEEETPFQGLDLQRMARKSSLVKTSLGLDTFPAPPWRLNLFYIDAARTGPKDAFLTCAQRLLPCKYMLFHHNFDTTLTKVSCGHGPCGSNAV